MLKVKVFAQEFSYEESDYGDRDDEDIKQLYIWLVKQQQLLFIQQLLERILI